MKFEKHNKKQNKKKQYKKILIPINEQISKINKKQKKTPKTFCTGTRNVILHRVAFLLFPSIIYCRQIK